MQEAKLSVKEERQISMELSELMEEIGIASDRLRTLESIMTPVCNAVGPVCEDPPDPVLVPMAFRVFEARRDVVRIRERIGSLIERQQI